MDVNLVVVDGSDTARNASRLAVQIAKVERQRLLGLYIIDESLVLDTYASYQKELGRDDRPASRAELTEWFQTVGNVELENLIRLCNQAEIPVETQILFGGVPELVLDYAAKAQMLTIGRRGRGHAHNPDYLGRNFRQIAHHARIPILAGGDIFTPLERLFLWYDGGSRFENALEWTVRLQRSLPAEVEVVASNLDDPQILSLAIQQLLSNHGLTDFHHVQLLDERIPWVLETMRGCGADLILIGGFRHPEFIEWLIGGKIDQILRQSQLPVLIA